MSLNTWPKLFRKQVAQSKNPRQALNDFRAALGDNDPRQVYRELLRNTLFRNATSVSPAPRTFANLWAARLLSSRGFKADLQWATEALCIHHETIADFLKIEREFEKSYLVGDWEHCLATLDLLEGQRGLSFWLISRRIAVAKRAAGPSDEDYASTLIASTNDGTLAGWLVYMMSFRSDPNVTPATYIRTVENALQKATLSDKTRTFLKYHALNFPPQSIEEAGNIIAASETCPIIDRYLAVVDTCQFIVSEFPSTSPERAIATVSIERLNEAIDDDRLALLSQLKSSEDVANLVNRVRSAEADLYTVGDYEATVTALSDLIQNAPEQTNLYSLLARATLRTDARPILPERIAKIVSTMAAVQIFSRDDDPSILELSREVLSGSHRLLSASIRRLYSGLGEDPSKSTLDASIEALNCSVLSPLQLRHLPIDNRVELLRRAQEAHPESIALELQAAVLNFGTDELDASLRGKLPKDRGDLYAARSLLRMSKLHEAVKLLEELESNPAVPVANDARRELFEAFIASGKHRHALRLVARTYQQNERLHSIFQIDGLLDSVEESAEDVPFDEISLSICYHVVNRFRGDKRLGAQADAAEEFVLSKNLELPSQIDFEKLDVDRDLLPLFLDQVCTPSVLDKFMAIESVSQVEVERLNICRTLSEIDAINRQQYLEEIREITRRRVVRDRFEQVERTKIYVDTDGVKRQAEKTLRDSYQRFVIARSDEANTSERIEMVRRVQELLADVRAEGLKIHLADLPANEGEQIFDRLVGELMRLLVSSQEYGLEAYLSTRVRHGTMGNQLRSAFELQSLLTQSDGGRYQPDSYWAEVLDLPLSGEAIWLADRLAKFSEDLDSLIEDLVRSRVQVRSDITPEGLFVFQTFNYDLIRLQAEITSDTSFDIFMDKVIEQFWTVLEHALGHVRRHIEEDFLASVHALTGELERDVTRSITCTNTSPLRDAIAAARTQMSVSVANVANWFTLARDMERPDYEFGIAVEVAIESIRVCHPSLDVTLERSDQVSFDCRGKTLESLVYMLFTALDNALEHSGFNDRAPGLSLVTSLKDNWLELQLVNSCPPLASIAEENERLDKLKKRLTSGDEAQGLATTEGGSGYAKILRILRHDLLTPHSLEFGYKSTTEYVVTIGMDAKVIIK